MYHVYILRCSDGTLYTGVTSEPERRIREHNSGKGSKYTRARLPVVYAYLESKGSRSSALRRETEIKRMERKEKLALCASQNHSSRWLSEPADVPLNR